VEIIPISDLRSPRAGQVPVFGPLDSIVRHLSFDGSRVVAKAPLRQELEEEFRRGLTVSVVKDLRGKNPGTTPRFGAPPGGPASNSAVRRGRET